MNIEEYISECLSYEHWKKIGIKDHHGFCIPLFSVRSKNSLGIGDFSDLFYLIDWCFKISMDVIQLLPINEVYFKDPSPYNALSSCALDPIYISLRDLPHVNKEKRLIDDFYKFQKLNHTKRIKHDKVRRAKFTWLKKYFHLFYKEFENDKNFLSFKKNHSWLKPYAVFRTLKDLYKKKWYNWPKNLQTPTDLLIDLLSKKYKENVDFYSLLQYLAFMQLEKVKRYATRKNIFIKGDIPILINPDSADVWYHRDIFDMTHVAGAPPDDFNINGHKWGFPIFDWDKLKKSNFRFWKIRLKAIENIYHLYRIDHVVGFFRIWAMRKREKAAFGRFLPKDPKKWKPQGEEHLKMFLRSSPLLPIAEDLGFIPNIVYRALKKFAIAGTKVPRWEKDSMHDYDRLSLTTLSTHDTETLDLFWKNKKNDQRRLCLINNWKYEKYLTFELRKKILYDTHHSNSIFHINLLQEYLALFPKYVWKNKKDERINISGVESKKNWTYRIKEPLETLTCDKEFIKVMRDIVK